MSELENVLRTIIQQEITAAIPQLLKRVVEAGIVEDELVELLQKVKLQVGE